MIFSIRRHFGETVSKLKEAPRRIQERAQRTDIPPQLRAQQRPHPRLPQQPKGGKVFEAYKGQSLLQKTINFFQSTIDDNRKKDQ